MTMQKFVLFTFMTFCFIPKVEADPFAKNPDQEGMLKEPSKSSQLTLVCKTDDRTTSNSQPLYYNIKLKQDEDGGYHGSRVISFNHDDKYVSSVDVFQQNGDAYLHLNIQPDPNKNLSGPSSNLRVKLGSIFGKENRAQITLGASKELVASCYY